MFNSTAVNSPHQLSTRRALVALACLSAMFGCVALGGCRNRSVDTGEGDPIVTSFPSAAEAYVALQGDWRLVEINGRSVIEIYESGGFDAARPPTLNITPQGGIGGFAGVNRVAGTLDADRIAKGSLMFAGGGAAMTKMAGPPELMALEDEFVKELSAGRALTLVHDKLTLTNDRGTTTAVLERAR